MTTPITAASSGPPAHAHASTKSNVPPAKAARDYLAANPEMPAEPFGELVSRYAKGETPTIAQSPE
jgi:hypothetical protein